MKNSWWMKLLPATLFLVMGLVMVPESVFAQFTYKPAGQLKAGSGTGRKDTKVYVPGMRFPLESAPAYANSQVWGRGGMNGGGGGQCDAPNYSYPWYDNYCETRSWGMPLCPAGKGHQGQDIRPATCTKNKHYVVAAEAGTVTSISTYSVNIQSGGTLHRYMHMNHSNLLVKVGQKVTRGQRLGLVSNNMGNTPTTIHLHYDLRQTVSNVGSVHVPTYMSLVRSYEALIGQPATPCAKVPAAGGVVDNEKSCFELRGNVTTWRNVTTAGQGGSLRWTYAYDGAKPDGIARWNLDMTRAGKYKVEAHIVAAHGKSKKARYVVRHKGAQKEVRLDQSAGAGWRSLGEFEFAAGKDQWVELYDNTGEPLSAQLPLMADAIRLTYVPPPCPKVPAAGGVVDNEGHCFELRGNAATWRNVTTAGQGGSLRWTYAYDGANPDGIARWNLDLTAAGKYKLEAHIVAAHGKSKKARYVVRHKGSQKEVRLDQSAGAGWRSLGEFDFAAGKDQWLELYDNTGESLSAQLPLMADAIRLSPVTPHVVEPEPDVGVEEPEPDVGVEEPEPEPDAGSGSEEPKNDNDPDYDPDYDPSLDPESEDVVREQSRQVTSTSSCSAVSVGAAGGSASIWGLLGLAGALAWVRRRSRVVCGVVVIGELGGVQ